MKLFLGLGLVRGLLGLGVWVFFTLPMPHLASPFAFPIHYLASVLSMVCVRTGEPASICPLRSPIQNAHALVAHIANSAHPCPYAHQEKYAR